MHPIYTGARRYLCLFPKVHFVYFSRYTSDLESSIRVFFLDINFELAAFPHPIHAVQNHFARDGPSRSQVCCHCMACTQLSLRSSGKGISGTCRVEMFL